MLLMKEMQEEDALSDGASQTILAVVNEDGVPGLLHCLKDLTPKQRYTFLHAHLDAIVSDITFKEMRNFSDILETLGEAVSRWPGSHQGVRPAAGIIIWFANRVRGGATQLERKPYVSRASRLV